MNAVFDSDFLIDLLAGVEAARDVPEGYDRRFISIVSFVEVLTGADTDDEDAAARAILDGFELVPVSLPVAERAVALRRARKRLRTPDAMIWATALTIPDCVLVTRNNHDFPEADPSVHIPYRL